MNSSKLTLVFFILICLEIGILLVLLPWVQDPAWDENYLLVVIADKMNMPFVADVMRSGYARGAVTGLGLLNILMGVWEIVHFKKTTRALQSDGQSYEPDSKIFEAPALPDNGPEGASSGEGRKRATQAD
ncbi:MAG TPA: hypothetical protein VIG62_04580 [Blastocatellia bacterium]|jgi:hypothetical protein